VRGLSRRQRSQRDGGTPALAGQHSFYAITQLFLFREGRRSNEA
jgi:cytochrome c553